MEKGFCITKENPYFSFGKHCNETLTPVLLYLPVLPLSALLPSPLLVPEGGVCRSSVLDPGPGPAREDGVPCAPVSSLTGRTSHTQPDPLTPLVPSLCLYI